MTATTQLATPPNVPPGQADYSDGLAEEAPENQPEASEEPLADGTEQVGLEGDASEPLFAAVPSSGAGARPRRIREVDFTRPTKFTPDQQRRLERAHESFCRTTASRLSAVLRLPIEIEVVNVQQLTWASVVTEIPQPTLFADVKVGQIGSHMVMSTDLALIVRLIERLLGSQLPPRTIDRELTEIELALATNVYTIFLEHLGATWEELLGLSLALEALESQVTNLQLFPPSEPILALTIAFRMEETTSAIWLVVPYRSIETVIDRLPSAQHGDSERALDAGGEIASAVASTLARADVEVRAEIGSVHLTVDEVLALRPGAVIELDTPASEGVTLVAENVPIHRARPGRSGRRRAIEIIERLGAPS